MSFPFFICVVPLFFFYVYESHTNMKWFVWYLANINLLQLNRVKKCDSKKWTTFTICLVDKIIGFVIKPEAYYASGLKDYVCYAFSFSKMLSFTAIIG